MPQTYIFDFDGTLVDSMRFVQRTLLDILDERKIQYPKDILKTMITLGHRGVADYYVREFSFQEQPEEIYELILQRLKEAYMVEVRAKPSVDDTLRYLKMQGCSLNILTASPHILLDSCIKRFGWGELFDCIWSTEDFYLTKSDPCLFIEVAKALGKKAEECYMVDDSVNALLNAKKAGLKVIGVYDNFAAEDENRIRAIAERYVMSFKELL